MNRNEKIKQELFDIYADSAVRSQYSKERAYFCPLCSTRFCDITGLTLDHVPAEALGLPTVKVLTCSKKCNSGSGTAQDQLLQAHLLHTLQASGPTEPHSLRLTLDDEKVNALVWKDQKGTLQVFPDPKHNKPGSVEAFLKVYEKASESTGIQLSTLVAFNQPLIRWALVREAYLLLFYHWGYWLLRKSWAKQLQVLLDDRNTPLHKGSVIQIPAFPYSLSPIRGEFLMAKTPNGQSCWLIPVIDDRYAVIPSDDPKQECLPLWKETANMANMAGPLECDKVVVDREVKNSSLWIVSRRYNQNLVPDHWTAIIPSNVPP